MCQSTLRLSIHLLTFSFSAAYFQYGNNESVSAEHWARVFNVNVCGYALMIKHVTPIMKKQKTGSIVNFASTLGLTGFPDVSPYATSKAAVLQLTRNMAVELGSFNIRVNSISPHLIDVPALYEHAEKVGVTKEQLTEMCVSKGCFKRLAQPQEISNAVVFLASDLCPYMTGTNLVVDGGNATL